MRGENEKEESEREGDTKTGRPTDREERKRGRQKETESDGERRTDLITLTHRDSKYPGHVIPVPITRTFKPLWALLNTFLKLISQSLEPFNKRFL